MIKYNRYHIIPQIITNVQSVNNYLQFSRSFQATPVVALSHRKYFGLNEFPMVVARPRGVFKQASNEREACHSSCVYTRKCPAAPFASKPESPFHI
ncbi:hypothetical protein PUN28_013573 [Cardiocondyla obscurior]|uniref:Uncharacterized protein n=1 Tax=Cardiocondyla obscurior TaxID=286306 RepID=A0AAW2F5A4_9HYME